MKVVALAEVKKFLSGYVEKSQNDPVLVTLEGKPAARIIGVEGEGFEDLMTRSAPEFWKLIESRRRSANTVSAEEIRNRLAPTARRKRTKRKVVRK